MPKDVLLTPEGLANLKSELDELTTRRRREVAQRIREAREFGDISENAEYEDAKQEQAFIEGRIMKLEAMIRNAKLIDEAAGSDEVHLGSIVKVKNLTRGSEHEYTIVGSAESDPLNSKISNDSPIGAALLGGKPGGVVSAQAPSGEIELKILSIRAGRRHRSKVK